MSLICKDCKKTLEYGHKCKVNVLAPSTNELELKEKLRALPRTEHISSKYPIDAYEDDLMELIDKATLQELKTMWNKTQPDTVPQGWEPETPEAKYLQKRIAQLEQQTKGGIT